jgi:hypothetical protein
MKYVLFLLLFAVAKSNAQEAAVGADCITAFEVFKKDTFGFASMTDGGSIRERLADCFCFENGEEGTNKNDKATFWFTWKCVKSGNFSFTITPMQEHEDFDFVVFFSKETNLKNPCTNQKIVRCMASGEENFPSICLGTTGLRFTEIDSVEFPGCYGEQNAFLKPLDMKKGERYYLYIKNETSINGFKIKFYGDALIGNETDK